MVLLKKLVVNYEAPRPRTEMSEGSYERLQYDLILKLCLETPLSWWAGGLLENYRSIVTIMFDYIVFDRCKLQKLVNNA